MFVDMVKNASRFPEGSRYFLFNNWARYSTSIESILGLRATSSKPSIFSAYALVGDGHEHVVFLTETPD